MDAQTDSWFERRTSRWQDWPLEALLAAKGETRISLVIPARNEAATVASIVSRVRKDLVDGVPLIDEIVVIDSDSTDATYDEARAAGATVHRTVDIRPDLGSHPGKGEAMWKSLFVTTGDLLLFMDADLIEWETSFLTGLVGPLLADADVHLVKAFYDRPLVQPGMPTVESRLEGGRVTQLVARPILALRWPELGSVIQPLAGEWAIRRSLFERLHVPIGYGVELGAVVDTYLTEGLDAIAQVDLGRRVHSHQPLGDLAAMAVELLTLAARRTGSTVGDLVELRQFEAADGAPIKIARDVLVHERPPMREVR